MKELTYNEYVDMANRASEMVTKNKFQEAIKVLKDLVESGIADLDKAVMCVNLAVVYDKMGQTADALNSYDSGISYESRHGRFFVAESKAAYLAQKEHKTESLMIYQNLLNQGSLMESDKERMRHNIRNLQK